MQTKKDDRLEKVQYISNRLIIIAEAGIFTGSVTIHFKKGDAMNEEDFKNERFFDLLQKKKITLE